MSSELKEHLLVSKFLEPIHLALSTKILCFKVCGSVSYHCKAHKIQRCQECSHKLFLEIDK